MRASSLWFPGAPLRRVARRLAPRVGGAIKRVFSEMEYAPEGWRASEGWNERSIADAQEGHWPVLVANLQGPGPLGVSHLPSHTTREDLLDHNIMMSYGYVAAMAAGGKTQLSILDWGGGAGHYYLYTRALLPELAVEYHCYDVENLSRLGKRLLPHVHIDDDEQRFLGRRYDVVISSSSLHYFEDWRKELGKLASATGEFLYVSRLQVVSRTPSFVVLHKPFRDGYPSLQGWCINRQELLSCAGQCGLTLVREFVFTEPWVIRRAPEKGQVRGYLLRRQPAPGSGS